MTAPARLLLVDDDPDLLRLSEQLRELNAQLAGCEQRADALDGVANREDFDTTRIEGGAIGQAKQACHHQRLGADERGDAINRRLRVVQRLPQCGKHFQTSGEMGIAAQQVALRIAEAQSDVGRTLVVRQRLPVGLDQVINIVRAEFLRVFPAQARLAVQPRLRRHPVRCRSRPACAST